MPRRKSYEFPPYRPSERVADAAVHVLSVLATGFGVFWLASTRDCCLHEAERLSLIVYMAGLSGMVLASAAYNLAEPGSLKETLRRIDHTMIYAMIAGTYTPFAVRHMVRVGEDGQSLWIVWGVALAGIVLKLAFPRRFERLGLVLYLGLGWAMIILAQPIWASLSSKSLLLLVLGGVLYTLGSALHLMASVPYHNAAWHMLVLVAAGCHFAAILLESGI